MMRRKNNANDAGKISTFKNEPEGFRDLKWGDPPTKGMMRQERNDSPTKDMKRGDEKIYGKAYRLPNSKMSFENAELCQIVYFFYEDRFFVVSLFFKGKKNYDLLETICKKRYGRKGLEEGFQKCSAREKGTVYQFKWTGPKSYIYLRYGIEAEKGVLSLNSTIIAMEKYKAGVKPRMGGQAVVEGVMMRSPKSVAIAIRKSDGKMVRKEQPYVAFTERFRFLGIPIIRGVVAYIESLYLGVKAYLFSVGEAIEDKDSDLIKLSGTKEERKKMRSMLPFLVIPGLLVIAALILFVLFYLPLLLVDLIGIKGDLLFNLADGLIRMAFFLTYIWINSLGKGMKRILQYHGAEHKSISAFEAGEDLTPESTEKYSPLHPRCGTSLLFTVMIVSIPVFMFLGRPSTILERLIRLLFVPLIIGASYEIFWLLYRKIASKIVKLLMAPGLWLQRFTTKEPDKKQVEVAITALRKSKKGQRGETK